MYIIPQNVWFELTVIIKRTVANQNVVTLWRFTQTKKIILLLLTPHSSSSSSSSLFLHIISWYDLSYLRSYTVLCSAAL